MRRTARPRAPLCDRIPTLPCGGNTGAKVPLTVVVDVREPWELELCRIDGSVSIPLGQIATRSDELPRERPLVLVCHHGGRSLRVVRWLREQGFSQVQNMTGGIDWTEDYEDRAYQAAQTIRNPMLYA